MLYGHDAILYFFIISVLRLTLQHFIILSLTSTPLSCVFQQHNIVLSLVSKQIIAMLHILVLVGEVCLLSLCD